MLTAYHREYRGHEDIWEERVAPDGEIRMVRIPGIITVHCDCPLGGWLHQQTDAEIRDRIPTFGQIVRGSGRYGFERVDSDDPGELTPAARVFLDRWFAGFGGQPVAPMVAAVKNDPVQIANALRERAARLERTGGDS
jgi:hypothetical protein